MLDFFKPSYKLTPEQNAKLRRLSVYAAVAMLLVVLAAAGFHAGDEAQADKPTWEIIVYARLYLVKVVGALGAMVLAVVASALEWAALDNTELARRLWVWDENDGAHVMASKKANAGIVLASLLVANGFILSQVVR